MSWWPFKKLNPIDREIIDSVIISLNTEPNEWSFDSSSHLIHSSKRFAIDYERISNTSSIVIFNLNKHHVYSTATLPSWSKENKKIVKFWNWHWVKHNERKATSKKETIREAIKELCKPL